MRTSTTTAELAKALSAAQGEFPEIQRDKEVKVATQKGQYTFKYAELSSIIEATKKSMAKHGLSIMSAPASSPEGLVLTTRLSHASGEWVEGDFPLDKGARPQDLGSQLTYFRRYAITGLLHIATDDDVDGGGEVEDHKAVGKQSQPKPPVKPPQKDKPITPPDDVSPNVLGKVSRVVEKVTPAGVMFWEIAVNDTPIVMPKAMNKAQEDLQGMILKDLDAAMQTKKTVEIGYSVTGKGNKVFASCKVYEAGEEPRL